MTCGLVSVVTRDNSPSASQFSSVQGANQSISVLTYNVWFREDLEVTERMNAIGGIVCEHNPHFICFQVCGFIYIFHCVRIWFLICEFGSFIIEFCREIAVKNSSWVFSIRRIDVKECRCELFAQIKNILIKIWD